ncbi:hypothetical protein DSM100688_0217 [Bifidobacterium ramosum]|uniref:Uncharacterized protein n=1 Tax=Bifidobacterium ramosum TaxID=1798158 RepID=A0A6L4X4N5_9BIFI|nr:hypothetical protein [Bifidobacterium ramosum]KAB8289137.1 hypothetical protein DSM100688_0217 [Bifidobacterium ramosum]NEG70848.1 hypothetical protein [Bifidobacterium ramosum]
MRDRTVCNETATGRRARRLRRMTADARMRNLLIVGVPLAMVAAKLMVAFVLPAKYFYDNNRILAMATGQSSVLIAWEGSYRVAANLFASVNLLGLDTMLGWSVCMGLTFTVVTMWLMLRADAPDTAQLLFLMATAGLLNIYVLTIGKDLIQFVFFLAVYAVLTFPADHPTAKIALAAAVLYGESVFFRAYYILVAALALAVYAVLSAFRRRRRRLGAVDVAAIVALLFAGVWAMIAVASRLMPAEYAQVMSLRAGYDQAMLGSVDSVTYIRNLIPGEGLPVFMANYAVNALRMMVPVELALRGVYYLPFFAFQLMVTGYLINLLRQINTIRDPALFLALCVFLGYALASFVFEPDFGSWTRHEAATFPVLHLLVVNRYQRIADGEMRILSALPAGRRSPHRTSPGPTHRIMDGGLA